MYTGWTHSCQIHIGINYSWTFHNMHNSALRCPPSTSTVLLSSSFVGTTGPTDCIVYFNSFKFCLRLHSAVGPLGTSRLYMITIVLLWSWDKIWNYLSNKWSLWAQWPQQMKLRYKFVNVLKPNKCRVCGPSGRQQMKLRQNLKLLK